MTEELVQEDQSHYEISLTAGQAFVAFVLLLLPLAAAPQPATPAPHAAASVVATPAPVGPAYAQLLSTGDQKTAEALATKLIEGGFRAAYVERGTSDKGAIFRVRVKFASDAEA